jgi:hypothetical protein
MATVTPLLVTAACQYLVLSMAQLQQANPTAAWTKGCAGCGQLSFAADGKSYRWAFQSLSLMSTLGSLATASGSAASSGTDPTFGAFDELSLKFGDDGSLAVRYFASSDAFLFLRQPSAPQDPEQPLQSSLPTVWPNFDVSGVPNGTQCLSWGEHYFFPGTVGPRVPHTNPKPADLRQCSGGGPLFFFTKPAAGGGAAAAMALSPLSHFSSNMISGAGANFTGLGVDAAGGHCGGSKRCQYFPTEGALGCSGATSSSCRWLCGRSLLLCKVCLGVCLQF